MLIKYVDDAWQLFLSLLFCTMVLLYTYRKLGFTVRVFKHFCLGNNAANFVEISQTCVD